MERVQLKRERERSEPNRMLFTDLAVERLRPPKAGQELYWDTAQKGLSLLVSGKGAKTFRSQYKLHGKWQTRTIGRFGETVVGDDAEENVHVAWARERVRQDRALANKGIDPKAEQETSGQSQSQLTYGDAVDQFVEKYAKVRQRTWRETQRVLKGSEKKPFPWLKRPIAEITKKDAYDLLDGYVAEGHGPKAKVTLAWLKTLWRWCWTRDLVPAPIMDAVKIDIERNVRDRVYSDDEIKAIWQAADKLAPVEGAYVKLLVLLAPRKGALAGLRRSHLDDPDNPTLWTTPPELTKSRKTAKPREYLTPLPPLAARILKSIPKRVGDPDLVFPGRHKGKPLSPTSPLMRKVIEAGAPADFYPHALRHTVATWLQNQGHSEWERGLILNHAGSSVTAGYSHGHALDLKRQLLEKWCQHVEGLVTAKGVALLR